VRKPSNKNQEAKPDRTISPSPAVFGGRKSDPVNLKREISTKAQQDSVKDIIVYGEDNALPLRIAQAVEESPAASSCIGNSFLKSISIKMVYVSTRRHLLGYFQVSNIS